jgi:hypothetical protein
MAFRSQIMTNITNNNPYQPVPASSKEDILADVRASASQRAAAREERRARFAQVMPEPKLSIVAWVDLLGFREQICNADTPEKFQAAYRRMWDVHQEFDKETASIHDDQGEVNQNLGKRILALSDGLVIALNLESDSPAAKVSSLYERMGSFLDALRLAQARCAFDGNLVRGGVATGYFWFQDDILLSPALVAAYEMESKKTLAQNPVIILHRELADELRAMKGSEGYRDDCDPMDDLFRDCEWMEEPARSEHVMLDFMPIFLDNHDPTPFLRSYHQRLIETRAAAPEKAKLKYDWLIKYAREFVSSELPSLEETIFGAP